MVFSGQFETSCVAVEDLCVFQRSPTLTKAAVTRCAQHVANAVETLQAKMLSASRVPENALQLASDRQALGDELFGSRQAM